MTIYRDDGLTSEMMRAGRGLLRWDQKDIADRTRLALGTVKRLETWFSGHIPAQARTVEAIRKAFADAGVTFIREVDTEARTVRYVATREFNLDKFKELDYDDQLNERFPDEVLKAIRLGDRAEDQ